MECKLVVGQHVVTTVSSEFWVELFKSESFEPITPLEFPVPGIVYTVELITLGEIKKCPVIQLEEIGPQGPGRVKWHGEEYVFDAFYFPHEHFRPLDRLKVEDFITEVREVELGPEVWT